jgi:hypothetical protein
MSNAQSGVNISLREIYDTLQEVKNEVKGIASKMNQVESDAAKGVEALQIAKEAKALAQKHEDGFKWLWRAIGAALITGLVGAFIAFLVLAIQLGIQNQIKGVISTQTPPATQQEPPTNTHGEGSK